MTLALRQCRSHLFVTTTVVDQFRNTQRGQIVPSRELVYIVPLSHSSVRICNLAKNSGRVHAGHYCQVHGSLRMTLSCQYAARGGPQWKYMAWANQVARLGMCLDRGADCGHPVLCRDPGRNALTRVDRHRKCSLKTALVAGDHLRQLQPSEEVFLQAQAHDPTAFANEKGHGRH